METSWMAGLSGIVSNPGELIMSTAQLSYNKTEVETIIRKYLETKGITVKSVKIQVRQELPDRPGFGFSGPVFDKAVVEIDPGDVVAQEE